MHIRRPPPGDGPTIYRPNESVTVRLDPPPRPVAYEPESIPPSPSARESILLRVNRSRGQILTVMVSIAAIASFGSVVWWAHNQDVKAGGRGLEPLVVQGPLTPSRVKPDNAGGMVPPNQDKEVFNRISPGATPVLPEKLLAEATTPKLPANGMPVPAGATKPADVDPKTASVAPATTATPAPVQPGQVGATPPPPAAAVAPAAPLPTITQVPATQPAESGPSIANLIEGLSGPTGGWRVQVASVKSEDVAKSTWARLQSAHGESLANLRMQAVRVDLGDKGVWYRVQAGPLDEKQAQSVCSSLKSRKADCVTVPPAR
jgi:cell division septation protein DedD